MSVGGRRGPGSGLDQSSFLRRPIAGNLAAHGLEGLLHGVNLVEDVAAVAVLLDHSLEASDLPLNPGEAGANFGLVGITDGHGGNGRWSRRSMVEDEEGYSVRAYPASSRAAAKASPGTSAGS